MLSGALAAAGDAEPDGPRRVAMTVDAVGGVWRYALDIAAALQGAGDRLLLLGSGPEPDRAARQDCSGLANVELAWTALPLDWLVESEAALDGDADTLVSMARDWGADLLHLNLPSQAAGATEGFPIVVAAHSCVPSWWEAMRGEPLPAAWRWQVARNRRGFERADRILVPSASHGEALCRVYGALGRVAVVYNSTRPATPLYPKREIILAAGRWWDEAKNAATLDAAAADAPWAVHMAGPLTGPNGERFTPAHAVGCGPLTATDMARRMQAAAIFAAPSRYEPFGLAVLEAGACGAALVLADLPVFRELWSDCALLVPADEPAAWTDAFDRLAADPVLRLRLGRAAAIRASSFSAQRQANGIRQAHRDAVRRQVRRRTGGGRPVAAQAV